MMMAGTDLASDTLQIQCARTVNMDVLQKDFSMKKLVLTLFFVLLAGCTPEPVIQEQPTSLPSIANEAQQVLVKFFELLNAGKYAEADELYGGNYETLEDWNPDVNPSDHVMLWARACEQNGLRCLLARMTTFKELQGDTYIFQVEFSNPDGSLFVLGPCCGANETEMPPVAQFEYKVVRNANGKFIVMDLPPYVP
jgi:hypothetical protein